MVLYEASVWLMLKAVGVIKQSSLDTPFQHFLLFTLPLSLFIILRTVLRVQPAVHPFSGTVKQFKYQ